MKKGLLITVAGLLTVGAIALLLRRVNPIIGRIISPFGYRTNPVTGKYEFHNGVDITASTGTPVKCPEHGVVFLKYNNAVGGNQLIIKHKGLYSGYAHLSSYLVNDKQIVKKGQIIAYTGATGQVTGPHLHFTILDKNATAVNPENYFDFKT